MSKIKIFALGGLNENGKNMYVIEVDQDIFIFDAGLKFPTDNYYGIDYIIPSYKYIKNNISRIKGIFLTHGHDENMGAICDIVHEIPEITIYATNLTMKLLKKELEMDNIEFNNFKLVTAHQKISFTDTLYLYPIKMTHSIPDCVSYALYTKDGIIFYTGDFTFDGAATELYKTDIGKLAYIGKQGVLCLLCESVYAGREGHTSPNHRVTSFIRDILNKNEKRIIFNVLPTSIYRLQELFNEVAKTNRKVVVMGKRLQGIIKECMTNNYLTVKQNTIGDINDLSLFNTVVLISNEREKPYVNIERIISGYDKFIKIKDTDTVVFLFPSYEATEKIAVKVADSVARLGANVYSLSNRKHLSLHASKEDLMMMINVINPMYYMPIKGEYRYQVMNADAASLVGIPDENILLKQNGEVISFVNGKLENTKETVDAESIFIDGKATNDVGELVLKDRELLSSNGIIIVSATLSKRGKEILAGPEINTKGFLYIKNNLELINEIKGMCLDIIKNNITTKYIDHSKVRTEIRDVVGKYIYRETESKPMIITVITEI